MMDNKQETFFDEEPVIHWENEWRDMPEYINREIHPHITIKVHFKTQEDYEKFAKLVDQNLTEKTKSIWYPTLISKENNKWRYKDES